jgi:hypothetical protein
MSNKDIDDAKLRDAAYKLWLEEGQPEGRDQEHWHKAIAALSPAEPGAESEAKPKAKAPRKTAPKAAAKPAAKPKAAAKSRKPKAP